MKVLLVTIGILIGIGLLIGGCIAVVNDEDSMRPIPVQLVSHERGDCEWEGDCGGQDYDQWRNEDRNRNRDRNRGAFSPGPFDRSPVDHSFNPTVCVMPNSCSSQGEEKKEPAPRKERALSEVPHLSRSIVTPGSISCAVPVPFHCDPKPTSLFPPSFDGVKSFVLATIKSGIEMGRLFAETTIAFVENLMYGIAGRA